MYDMPTIYNKTEPRARKEYQCSECQRKIYKGEPYAAFTVLWEGEWETYRMCLPCDHLVAVLAEEFQFTEVWEHIREYFGANSPIMFLGPPSWEYFPKESGQ